MLTVLGCGKLKSVTPPAEAPKITFLQHTAPEAAPSPVRAELVSCWTAVLNAGGAVVAAGLPMPPVEDVHVAPEVDRLAEQLRPERLRILTARAGSTLAGWLVVVRDQHPLVTHVGTVHHVQTRPEYQGRGIGARLMRYAAAVAREEMALEQLHLSARSGLGLEDFYARLGWKEIGRWPGALRIAPGDDRDDVLMHLTL